MKSRQNTAGRTGPAAAGVNRENSMQSFTFQTTRSVLVEPGSSGRLGELFAGLGCRKVLLVTDQGIRDAGLLEAALGSLSRRGIEVSIFSDVVADPPESIVRSA